MTEAPGFLVPRGRHVEVLVIGSELTVGHRTDTNSVWLRRQLRALGLQVQRVTALPDTEEVLAAFLREAAARADLIVATGGLGPTVDDRTVDAVARAAAVPVEVDTGVLTRLAELLARRGRTMTPAVERMARLPRGAAPLENERGTAPGFVLQLGGALIVALPGVPDEMEGIFARHVAPRLAPGVDPSGPAAQVCVRIAGLEEAVVDDRAAPLCQAAGVELTTLTAAGSVELHLGGTTEAVRDLVTRLAAEFGADFVSADGSAVEEVVIAAARRRPGTIAVAESCTGGRILSRLTSVPGASAVLSGGWVPYTPAAKTGMLGVPASLIGEAGVVSEAVAAALATQARRALAATWSVAVTGVAGPTGGTDTTPIGLVCFATDTEGRTRTAALRLAGSRQRIQELAAGIALDLLRRTVQVGSSA